MQLTDIEVKDTLYSLLREKALQNEITGQIYKDFRPANSQMEDVEISVLDGNARQLQEIAVNVNVFVHDIPREDEYIENTPRLRTLCRTFWDSLQSNVFGGFKITLQSQRTMKVNDRNIHVINNRLMLEHISEAEED